MTIARRPGIRLQLTLLNAAVLVVILAIAAIAVYLFVGDRLETNVRDRLDAGYNTVRTVIGRSGGDLGDVSHLGHDVLFRIVQDSEIVYRTEAWNRLRLDPLPSFDGDYGEIAPGDGRLFLLRRGKAGPDLSLVCAVEATAAAESLRTLRLVLFAVLPVALVLALAAGYFLSGRALAPVAAITRTARAISADRLSERLPVHDPGDEIGGLAVVFNETLARLEGSFERLKRFTADASHELRTPLTSIRSTGEVALGGALDAEGYREVIGSILEETEQLTRLVDDLLLLARGDAEPAPAGGRIDLSALVLETAEELRVLAEEKEQALELDLAAGVVVQVDRRDAELAATNVIHNAIRYTPPGGRIDVQLAAGRGSAVIEVTDDGPGIVPAERERVFDRFYRIDKGRAESAGGTGLGLAIARRAIERAGGSIGFVDPPPGRGARCRIVFPVAAG